MSETLARILRNVTSRSAMGVYEPRSEDRDDSLCWGDYTDCIGVELHGLKQRLISMADDAHFAGLLLMEQQLRALIEDL